MRQGWYFTGDTGYFDADGDLFVTGRVDDMIITGGENVSPVEIESCLSLHPAVSEVAVVGLPDERWGKVVAAFVRRATKVDAEALDTHCRVVRPRQLQAAAPLRVRRRDSEIPGRQAVAPQTGRGGVCRRGEWRIANGEWKIEGATPFATRYSLFASLRNGEIQQMPLMTFTDPRLAALDGFRVEIDESRERADVILDRPPFNIISMPQRDQLRLVFETLDEDARVRVIVLRAIGRAFLLRRQHQGFHGGDT